MVILPCLQIFLNGSHYICYVFLLGFVFLMLKGLIGR